MTEKKFIELKVGHIYETVGGYQRLIVAHKICRGGHHWLAVTYPFDDAPFNYTIYNYLTPNKRIDGSELCAEIGPAPEYNCGAEEPKKTEHAKLEQAFDRLKAWAEAYPITSFPEPDFKKARAVLTASDMSLDAISASNMRHVITQVKKILDEALREK